MNINFTFAVILRHIKSHTILEEFYCKDADVQYGRSLKGGSAAGLFDPLGTVKNIQVRADS